MIAKASEEADGLVAEARQYERNEALHESLQRGHKEGGTKSHKRKEGKEKEGEEEEGAGEGCEESEPADDEREVGAEET